MFNTRVGESFLLVISWVSDTLFISFFHTSTFQLLDKPWWVSPVLPPQFLPSIRIAHRVQQSHCSSIFHRVLLTHAVALSACQLVHKKNSARLYRSMHSGGFELTKLTYTRLEDNLIRHRGDVPLRRTRQLWCVFAAKSKTTSFIQKTISFRTNTEKHSHPS